MDAAPTAQGQAPTATFAPATLDPLGGADWPFILQIAYNPYAPKPATAHHGLPPPPPPTRPAVERTRFYVERHRSLALALLQSLADRATAAVSAAPAPSGSGLVTGNGTAGAPPMPPPPPRPLITRVATVDSLSFAAPGHTAEPLHATTTTTPAPVLPSSILAEILEVQADLETSLDDLQTHVKLSRATRAAQVATLSQSNQTSALITSLLKLDHALATSLTAAAPAAAQLAAVARLPADPANVVDYARFVGNWTSPPSKRAADAFIAGIGAGKLGEMVHGAWPMEKQVRAGVLMAAANATAATATDAGAAGTASSQPAVPLATTDSVVGTATSTTDATGTPVPSRAAETNAALLGIMDDETAAAVDDDEALEFDF
ncbi:hypothetical protein BC828DRAFT_384417 [Blastocladiella britannica]|nr:hypothetical protein BC828DRAFT_384417 [Blastocladiella britannica]